VLDLVNILLYSLEKLLLLFEARCSTGLCYGTLGDLAALADPSLLAICVDLLLGYVLLFCRVCLLGGSFTLLIDCKVVLNLSCKLVHELVLNFFNIWHVLSSIYRILIKFFFRDDIFIVVRDFSCRRGRYYGRLVQFV